MNFQSKMLSRPEGRLLIEGTLIALWITVEVWLIYNWEIGFTSEIFIGVASVVFGILATLDSSRAYQQAKDLQESVGSFLNDFRHVLHSMEHIVIQAENTLSILVPNPAYGFLFDEEDRCTRFVEAIIAFIAKPNTRLQFYIVIGDRNATKEMLPQRYLRRLLSRKDARLHAKYCELIETFFEAMKTHADRVELTLLRIDPSVRIIIADAGDYNKQKCLISFAQSDPSNGMRVFESKGFTNTRSEMVHAAGDLLARYKAEFGIIYEKSNTDAATLSNTIRYYFTTLIST